VASIFSLIRAQVLTDLAVTATTTLTCALEGPLVGGAPMAHPYAVITWGDAKNNIDCLVVNDRERDLLVEIYGKTNEQVDLATENISALWESGATRAAMQALRVIDIAPDTDHPAQSAEGINDTFVGSVQFTVIYRQ
jgi:hypothetical protein